MFGYIEIQTNEKPRSCVKTILNAARRFYGKTDVAIRETEVCGLHLYRCGVTFPYGCTDVHRQRCLENAARKLYHGGVRCAAVREQTLYGPSLRAFGIRLADPAKLYRAMYPAMLRKLAELLGLERGEGHLIVYALQATGDVVSFCESAARMVRQITVIGPGMMPDLGRRLLDHYGIASCPVGADGSLRGDLFTGFDLPDELLTPFVSGIEAKGAILPYKSMPQTILRPFVYINDANFCADKYAPYAVGDRDADQSMLAILHNGGFLRTRDLSVEALLQNETVIQ